MTMLVTMSVIIDSVAEQVEEQAVITDPVSGEPYLHANLRSPGSLRGLAEAAAVKNPNIASALSNIPKYFVADANGDVVPPKNPVRVWA